MMNNTKLDTCSICKAVDIRSNMSHASCTAESFSFCVDCCESEEWNDVISCALDHDPELSMESAWVIFHALHERRTR